MPPGKATIPMRAFTSSILECAPKSFQRVLGSPSCPSGASDVIATPLGLSTGYALWIWARTPAPLVSTNQHGLSYRSGCFARNAAKPIFADAGPTTPQHCLYTDTRLPRLVHDIADACR